MAKDTILSPFTSVAGGPPAGNKGGPGVYNGDKSGPLGSHPRTSSPDGVPEKVYDNEIPSGDKELITPNQLPKNI